jgi:hypothetical protein
VDEGTLSTQILDKVIPAIRQLIATITQEFTTKIKLMDVEQAGDAAQMRRYFSIRRRNRGRFSLIKSRSLWPRLSMPFALRRLAIEATACCPTGA